MSELGGPFDTLGGIVSGFARGGPAGAGIAMIGDAVGFLKDSVGAAAESERVMTALKTAVENQGTAWGTVKEGIDKTLQSMQSTSRFSDEELAQALATLVQHGMDVNEAMKALPTAMDAAVGSGKPLSEIATAVGKAFEGQNTGLTRLVPAIGDLDKSMGAGATSGDKFQAALGILNDRYGGTALSDAQTYAGTQERLGNAWDTMQEKVGTMLLPALASITEGMIPVVDALGKGVEGVQGWLTEVGKMPEVKGFMDEAGKAFDGFWKYLEDLWKFVQDTFGPALSDLGEAFKTLWDALSPIVDALGEIFGAMSAGGESVDPLKLWLQALAGEIKLIAEAIKLVAPVIKAFGEGFKTAAEFLIPILKQISEGVGKFLDDLKTAFQGFYDWLVGASLWQDMWNAVSSIAMDIIGKIIAAIGSAFFKPLQDAFNLGAKLLKDVWEGGWNAIQAGAKTVWDTITTNVTPWIEGVKNTIGTGMDNAKTAWDTAWGAVKTTTDTLLPQAQTFLNTKFDEMKGYVETSTSAYGPTMTSALGGMQGAMNAGFLLVKGDWQGALDAISGALTEWGTAAKGLMDGIMGQLKGAMDQGIGLLKGAWDTFTGGLSGAVNFAQGAIDQVTSAFGGVGKEVQPGTQSAMTAVTDTFQETFDAISGAATGFWNWLTGHSLWPDMLGKMSGQTRDYLIQIGDTFSRVFASVDQELSARFQSMFEGTKEAMSMILQVITGNLTDIRDNFMSNAIDVQRAWSDAWTEINREAATTTQQIFDGLTTWWSMLQANFMTGLTTISGAWQTSWTSILDTAANICGQIGAGLTAWFSQATALFMTNLTILQTNWQTSWTEIMNSAANICGQIMAGLTTWYQLIEDTTTQNLAVLKGNFQNALSGIYSMFTGTFSSMVSAAQGSMSAIVSTVTSALSQIRVAAAQLQAVMVTGSIWPDMMDTMESITSTAMSNIQQTVTSGFASTVASAQASMAQLEALRQRAVAFMGSYTGGGNVSQAFAAAQAQATQATTQAVKAVQPAAAGGVFGGGWEPATPLNLPGGDLAAYAQKLGEAIFTATIGRSSAGGPATAEEVRQAQLNATLPISVVVDGVTVSRVVEQRMISQRQLAGGY